MTERAAHLVDYVFPDVPVRQWVLTLPSRIRYALAWDHDLCRAVIAVFVRAVLGWYRRHARRRGVSNERGGAVVIVQRFGSALNLNVHLHALVLDGVFTRGADGTVRFHAAPVHPAPDLMPLLVTIATRLRRLVARRGVVDGSDALDGCDPFEDDAPTLAGLAAASVRGVAALAFDEAQATPSQVEGWGCEQDGRCDGGGMIGSGAVRMMRRARRGGTRWCRLRRLKVPRHKAPATPAAIAAALAVVPIARGPS